MTYVPRTIGQVQLAARVAAHVVALRLHATRALRAAAAGRAADVPVELAAARDYLSAAERACAEGQR